MMPGEREGSDEEPKSESADIGLAAPDEESLGEVTATVTHNSSGGARLYLSAAQVEQLGLANTNEVPLRTLLKDGDVRLEVDVPVGFTLEEFEKRAAAEGWEETDRREDYRDRVEFVTTGTAPQIKIKAASGPTPEETSDVEVTVLGPTIHLEHSRADRVELLQAYDLDSDFRVEVYDSAGHWALLHSDRSNEAPIPDEQELRQLLNAADTVTLQIKWDCFSRNTSLDEVVDAVSTVEVATAMLTAEDDASEKVEPGSERPNEDESKRGLADLRLDPEERDDAIAFSYASHGETIEGHESAAEDQGE